MKIGILFIFILLFGACKTSSESEHLHQKSVYSIEDSIFTYRLFYDELPNGIIVLKKLEVINKKNRISILNDSLNFEIPKHYLSLTITEDFNFDGYNDIKIPNYYGVYTSSYSVWIFDSLRNSFQFNTALDEINNPVLLKECQEICSKYRVGLNEYYLLKFKWIKNELVLTEKYEERWTDKGHLTITKLLNNGGFISKDSLVNEKVVELMECDCLKIF